MVQSNIMRYIWQLSLAGEWWGRSTEVESHERYRSSKASADALRYANGRHHLISFFFYLTNWFLSV